MRKMTMPAVLLLALLGIDRANEPSRSPQQLTALLAAYDAAPAGDARIALLPQIDAAAAQKDAIGSRLYWHTDLDEALAVAKAENKPVLSLRLLGRLDEELSCANSRFFRKSLYSVPAISQLMRKNFVLHWESLRPVPVITIDFGDGRQIKRTITGNSIHYVLTPGGTVLDALPGLYDPATFESELKTMSQAFAAAPITTDSARAYRSATGSRLIFPRGKQPKLALQPAQVARPIAVAKSSGEIAPLRAMRNPSDIVFADAWQNQSTIRPRILSWLNVGSDSDLISLNKRVYAELFLSPLDDPNMGLVMPDEAALFAGDKGFAPLADAPAK